MVYLIECEENKTCKIGFSKNPEKRIRELRTSNSHDLNLVYCVPGDRHLENTLHTLFNEFRLNGEWFKIDQSIIDKFKNLSDTLGDKDNKDSYILDEPFRMYKTTLNIFLNSSDVSTKLMGYVILNFADSSEFSLSRKVKDVVAKEVNCSSRSLDNAVTFLVKNKFLIRVDRGRFVLNPRHIFKGSSLKRKERLRGIIGNYCPDC